MTLKLYTVTIETEIVVVASDVADAEEQARDHFGDLGPSDFGFDGRPMQYLPGDWEMGSIPYGECADGDPDRTIAKWIEVGAAPAYTKRLAELAGQTVLQPSEEKR